MYQFSKSNPGPDQDSNLNWNTSEKKLNFMGIFNININGFSSCISLNSYGNLFSAFWTNSRSCKRFLPAILVTFNVSDNRLRVWQQSSSSNASKSSLNFFVCPWTFFHFKVDLPLLNRQNNFCSLSQIKHVHHTLPEASDDFQQNFFFLIKAKKQSFPDMLFRWFETWNFRRYKKM